MVSQVEVLVEELRSPSPPFKQAEKMKESGKAKSDLDAARKIAKDTGETETAVRKRIQRGHDKVAQGGQSDLSQDNSFILSQASEQGLCPVSDKQVLYDRGKAYIGP